MSITTDVELSVLWDSYQLEPYHGLRKPCDQDVITSLSRNYYINYGITVSLLSCRDVQIFHQLFT